MGVFIFLCFLWCDIFSGCLRCIFIPYFNIYLLFIPPFFPICTYVKSTSSHTYSFTPLLYQLDHLYSLKTTYSNFYVLLPTITLLNHPLILYNCIYPPRAYLYPVFLAFHAAKLACRVCVTLPDRRVQVAVQNTGSGLTRTSAVLA